MSDHGLSATPEITAMDKAAAGGAPAADQSASVADATQPQPGGADGAQPDQYKPAGAFEHLLGQSDRETIDKYHNAYKGARDELAKGRPEPMKAADFKWNWSDRVKGAGGIASDDAAVKGFAAIAEEHGYSQQQIDAIPKFFDMLVEKGMIEKPFDSASFLEELAPSDFRGSSLDKQARGGERLAAAEAWIKQLDDKQFDPEMKTDLRLLTVSKGGVRVLEHMMRGGMVQSVSPGGGAHQGAVTKAALDARTADPRNDSTRHDTFDPAFAEETRRMFKTFYGA